MTEPPSAPDELWRRGPVWTASGRPLARYVARPIREFLHVESAGSLLLLAATVAALLWVNLGISGWAEGYDHFWHTPLALEVGDWRMEESLQHWVNDGLMTIFFFVVGLEIKYELVHGDLRDPRTAALPIVAAVGGMAVPALLYAAIAGGGPDGAGAGWGIPMATDIAFAVGVLGVLGDRVPSAARLFLLTLAIVDDIGAILVIAVFYTDDLALGWLAVALGLLAVMAVLRAARVWAVPVYVVLGVATWFALLESGVHATLAGVAIGLLTPAVALLRPDVATGFAADALRDNELDADELHRLRFLVGESVPMVERLQARLHPLSSYVVLPVFALANAGVALDGFGDAVTSAVGLGIGVGLVVGKPLGIVLACFLAIRLGVGRMPAGTTWAHLLGVGAVAGIGFTVSLFIAGLSFPGSAALTDEAKVGILLASVLAAVIGVLVLLLATRRSGQNGTSVASSPDPSPRPESTRQN
ncbi:Na+/H+ antiporter NhaA [Nocardioides aromaticivorans]|uniref:Na+/H+ antiporter NhaA n=1 Tax=Nocardioides aromaticivorans TaxID=200618 RepID=UPI001A8E96D0|nr:Na+/H+ antiporter NhaA [Nocardioides aromaticivorans]